MYQNTEVGPDRANWPVFKRYGPKSLSGQSMSTTTEPPSPSLLAGDGKRCESRFGLLIGLVGHPFMWLLMNRAS